MGAQGIYTQSQAYKQVCEIESEPAIVGQTATAVEFFVRTDPVEL